MSTQKRTYLNHIRRLREQVQILTEAMVEQRRQVSWLQYSNGKLRHELKPFTNPESVKVALRRSGESFYLIINKETDDQKFIKIASTENGHEFNDIEILGLDFSILNLTFSEVTAIKPEVERLQEQLELFVACPSRENQLDSCDFSKREFIKILKWWALYDNEVSQIQHLYSMKYDHEYRGEQFRLRAEERAKEKQSSAATPRLTWVYLMRDTQTNYYKIGQSRNPAVRESTLFSEKPSIVLICAWQAEGKEEKQFHQKFQEKNIRGEWFQLEETDIQEIYNHFQDRQVFEIPNEQ